MVKRVRERLQADLILCKVARWDPDKRWNQAVEAIARLRDSGLRTLLLARGGIEPHGREVMQKARSLGLRVSQATTQAHSCEGYLAALEEAAAADIVDVTFPLPLEFLRVIYQASDGVLANSGHEPFGLVGLEAMAAGGIAFTGCTGEDYAIPFVNCFALETADPLEIVGHLMYLREHPAAEAKMRDAARRTAEYFTWEAAVQNLIAKLEYQARTQGTLRERHTAPAPQLLSPQPIPVSPPTILETPDSGEQERERVRIQERMRVRVPV